MPPYTWPLRKKTVSKLLFLSFIIVLMLSSSACSKAPTIENIRQVEVLGVHKGVAAIEIQCDVTNPNMFGLTILNSDFKFAYNEVDLGEFQFEDDFSIPAGGTSSVEVEANIYLDRLHESFPKLTNEENVVVSVSGDVDYKVFFVAGNSVIDEEFNFDYFKTLQELLDIALNKRGVNDFSKVELAENSTLLKPVLRYDYTVSNDFGVPFTLRDIDLHFRMNESRNDLANWNFSDSINVPEYDTAVVPMRLGLNATELTKSVFSGGLFGSSSDDEKKEQDLLRITGTIRVEVDNKRFSIPIEYEREVDLKDLGLF
jgi:LEA14-like dessication related protein